MTEGRRPTSNEEFNKIFTEMSVKLENYDLTTASFVIKEMTLNLFANISDKDQRTKFIGQYMEQLMDETLKIHENYDQFYPDGEQT